MVGFFLVGHALSTLLKYIRSKLLFSFLCAFARMCVFKTFIINYVHILYSEVRVSRRGEKKISSRFYLLLKTLQCCLTQRLLMILDGILYIIYTYYAYAYTYSDLNMP